MDSCMVCGIKIWLLWSATWKRLGNTVPVWRGPLLDNFFPPLKLTEEQDFNKSNPRNLQYPILKFPIFFHLNFFFFAFYFDQIWRMKKKTHFDKNNTEKSECLLRTSCLLTTSGSKKEVISGKTLLWPLRTSTPVCLTSFLHGPLKVKQISMYPLTIKVYYRWTLEYLQKRHKKGTIPYFCFLCGPPRPSLQIPWGSTDLL